MRKKSRMWKGSTKFNWIMCPKVNLIQHDGSTVLNWCINTIQTFLQKTTLLTNYFAGFNMTWTLKILHDSPFCILWYIMDYLAVHGEKIHLTLRLRMSMVRSMHKTIFISVLKAIHSNCYCSTAISPNTIDLGSILECSFC